MSKTSQPKRKLDLDKKTLRRLDPGDLGQVAGGTAGVKSDGETRTRTTA